MRKNIFIYCFMAVLLLAMAFPCLAAETDTCADARDAALNARNALRTFFSAKGEYPEKLSGTNFSPADNVVVIYERMNLDQPKDFYMVRTYAENCGTMYLAAPTASEVIQIPLVPGGVKQAGKAAEGDAKPPAGSSGSMAFLVATVTFFAVFILVIMIFYFRIKKTVSETPPEQEKPPTPTDSE